MIQEIPGHSFDNQYHAGVLPTLDSFVLCYQGAQVGLHPEHRLLTVADLPEQSYQYLFQIDGMHYFLPTLQPEESTLCYRKVREICGDLTLPKFQRYAIMTGKHLSDWYRDTQFCGRCGRPLHHAGQERAMVCDTCQKRFYPRIMPAVIVGVTWGDRLLLTRYRTGISYYALVAGFTEIGETLEETVAREVLEETGVRVKNIRYYKSQPWGLANDLLAGFYCDVDGDPTIHMDDNELKFAQWIPRQEIVLQPDDASLTNEMMRQFRNGQLV